MPTIPSINIKIEIIIGGNIALNATVIEAINIAKFPFRPLNAI